MIGCCSSQEELPPDEVCRDVGLSVANRTEACTGDRDLASRRWSEFETQYSCLVTTVDDRMRQHYVCPAEIMKMGCEQFIAYGEDFDALFRSIPECLLVVGRTDGTPIQQPDAGTPDSGTDAADAADAAQDVIAQDAESDAPTDVVDSSADVPVEVSDSGDESEPDAAQLDASLDASDASVPPDVEVDAILVDAPIESGSEGGDGAVDAAEAGAGIGALPRIESYTQGTAPLSNDVFIGILGQNFDTTSQMVLAGNPLALNASNLPVQLLGQGTASTPPHGYYKLQVINGPVPSGARSNIVYYTVAPASGSPELLDYSRVWVQPGYLLQLIGRNFPTPTFVVADAFGVEATATVQGALAWRGQAFTAASVIVPAAWQSGQLQVRTGGEFLGPLLWVEQSLTSSPGTTVAATSSYPGYAPAAAVDNDLNTAWIEQDVCGTSCTDGASLEISLGAASPLKQLLITAARNIDVWNSVVQARVVLEDSGGSTLLDETFKLPAERYDLHLDFAQPFADVHVIRVQILGDNNVRTGFSEVAAYAN